MDAESFKNPLSLAFTPLTSVYNCISVVSSQVGGHLAVVGGGGFPYPGGEDTAEVLTEEQEWRAFRYPGVDRAFGVGIQV